MNEKLLQFIWQYQIFNAITLTTVQHEKLHILQPGIWNQNQGPDFKFARILLNGQEWIGNIELHVFASDWNLHQHDQDPNYHNVILHVVWQNDLPEQKIPVLELESRVPSLLLGRYKEWSFQPSFVSCANSAASLNEQIISPFISWLSAKRLQQKSLSIVSLVESLSGNWEEAFWRHLAKSFGHKVNAESFERMAENLPYKLLIRHHHQLKQIEAMLFGQAGLLNSNLEDAYAKELHDEFLFLRKKYQLKKNVFPLYFLRMRPINFPTVRLAQLAMLIHTHPDLFRKIKDVADIKEIKKILRTATSTYWDTHYRFDEPSVQQVKTIGDSLVDKLIMNTILPFIRVYQMKRGRTDSIDQLDEWPQLMKAENNTIISGYARMGWHARNMKESQGLIELKTTYCDQLKCLDCAIGRHLLRRSN